MHAQPVPVVVDQVEQLEAVSRLRLVVVEGYELFFLLRILHESVQPVRHGVDAYA